MKKSLILLGMLSIGYTYAQSTDSYEGKVGVNTEVPSATLNVKSKTGTGAITKNLELQNANDKKLVTVLDDGKVGIGTETPKVELSVIGGGNFTKGVNAEETVSASWLVLHSYGRGLLSNNIRWRNGAYRFIRGTATDTKEGGWLFHSNFNRNTPFLLSVASNEPTQEDDVANLMTTLTVNRDGNLGVNTFDATEKLQVEGKIKTSSLAGTGDRPVYADANGVLKIGDVTDATLKATDTSEQCTADKAGTIHYKEVAISGATNGEKKGVFGFCTKQNGVATWVYLSNGGNIMQGTGTFGQGL